jgi:antirestriction protein ArdC
MDSNNNSSTNKVDVYQIVTDRIISLLEQGTVPWQMPWHDVGIPMNLLSKRPYRGINLWLLLSLNYERNLFLTWDQLKKIGASVNAGEHGHVVIYWKTPSKSNVDDNEKQKQAQMLRYYKVWNISQCKDLPENIVEPLVQKEHDSILDCEAIINGMPESPLLVFTGKKAYYDIQKDTVVLPKLKSFKSIESYYATLFHELVHSTGSEKRLKRKSIAEMAEFGSDMYSLEELVAELGSAYLSSLAGILNVGITNSAAYINGWLGKLKYDKKFIVHASGFAQKGVDFILNHNPSTLDVKEEVEQSEQLSGE